MEQFGLFIGTLMQSRNQAHIYHLQTKSFAEHKALQDYYEAIVDHIDSLVETYQGRYGILYGYQMGGTIKEDGGTIMYFQALCKFVEGIREAVPQDSYLQNQVDEVVALIESTKYKLINLK